MNEYQEDIIKLYRRLGAIEISIDDGRVTAKFPEHDPKIDFIPATGVDDLTSQQKDLLDKLLDKFRPVDKGGVFAYAVPDLDTYTPKPIDSGIVAVYAVLTVDPDKTTGFTITTDSGDEEGETE